jgi:hypothetical protein
MSSKHSNVGSAARPIVLNNSNNGSGSKKPNKPNKSQKRSHGNKNNGNASNGNGNNGSGSGAGPSKKKSKKQRKSPYPCGCKKWIPLTNANIGDYDLHSEFLQCRKRDHVGDGHVLIAYFVHNDIGEEGGDYYCPCSKPNEQGVMDERCSGSVTYFCRKCRRSVAPEAAEAENSL